ncbi:MAG: response regulator transcription factor [Chloroflexi bacterium]|nr:response regulator transcription factor [Chloroflexota bacterium]
MTAPIRSSDGPLILVVDDEPRLVRLVKANLERLNYRVVTASNGEMALKQVEASDPDLVILDVMMPIMDGYETTRRIREFSQIPIVMLTAKSEQIDKLKGFDLGADDYLTKPFDPEELVARVRAVLKRTQFQNEPRSRPTFHAGPLTIDFARHHVTVNDREVKLSPTEYRLLVCLATNADRVLLHEELLQQVWGPEYRDETEYLWVYIRYLRQKLETDPAHPQLIVSEPGVGYMLRRPPQDAK